MAIVHKEDVLHEIDLGFFTRKVYVYEYFISSVLSTCVCVLEHVIVELVEGTIQPWKTLYKASF